MLFNSEEQRQAERENNDFRTRLERIAGQVHVDMQREREAAEEARKAERKARAKQRCELVGEQLAERKKEPVVAALLAVLGRGTYPKQVESPISLENVRHLGVDDIELCAKVAHALCDGEPVDYVFDGSRRSVVRKLLARSWSCSTATTLAEMASRLAHSIVDDVGSNEFGRVLASVCTLLFLGMHGCRVTVDFDTFVDDFRYNAPLKNEVSWRRVEQRIAAHSSIVVW